MGGPVVFAPDEVDSLRFYMDYRKLNMVTERNSCPTSQMHDCVGSLRDALIISNQNANCSSWQLDIEYADRGRTEFT